jgi:uncharacterized protein (TIGR03382 family)
MIAEVPRAMFVFGHLGFGSVLARPWRHRAVRWALLLGMLLPDIIDKPLYYARLSDVFSCTRTIGHTGLLAVALLLAGLLMTRRRWLAALAIGMLTHLVLDCLMDAVVGSHDGSAARAALWPVLGVHYARIYMPSVAVHIHRLVSLPVFVTEVAGALLLAWELMRKPAGGSMR